MFPQQAQQPVRPAWPAQRAETILDELSQDDRDLIASLQRVNARLDEALCVLVDRHRLQNGHLPYLDTDALSLMFAALADDCRSASLRSQRAAYELPTSAGAPSPALVGFQR
jgi:hypothetical protein